MRMLDFTHHRPGTIDEACAMAGDLGDGAIFLAGGTEIVPDYRRGAEKALHLISLRGVEGLDGIIKDGEYLRIGAMARIEDIAASPVVLESFPALAKAASKIGGLQIRHQATIGGNFCRAVPCADTPPPCIAGEGQVRIAGPYGEKIVPAEDFFTGPRQTVLRHGEIMVEVLIPVQPENSGTSFQRFSKRNGAGLAVASVAARLVLRNNVITGARVAMGAVAPVPLPAEKCCLALVGQKPAPELFANAAAKAAAEAQPITDIRGTEEFRRELVKVLTVRALEEAASLAAGGK